KLFEARYQLKARVIIDEAGNFGAADPDFTDQIIYHARQCLSDARVIAVTYFLWLDPTHSPGNLPNSWSQRVQNLSDHLGRLKAMADVPITTGREETPPEQSTIRILFDDGSVRTLELEDYLRAVVPAEMPALWPPEAVKAQAVASRTYAQYAIENPRHPNADLCTNPAHCQNFRPDRVHPKSDEAIQATRGLIARYNGQTINAFFSANCGGHTLNNEDVFPGAPLPYLRGVTCPDSGDKRGHGVGLCQYGARALAQQGRLYDQIVKHYYSGVTLGPPAATRTSTILGLIVDFAGQPAANVKIVLLGQSQRAEMISRSDGSYRFNNVPVGSYVLELPDFQLRQENVAPFPGQDLVVNLTLPAPVQVELSRGPGLPLIVGDWGQPDVPITFRTPSGDVYRIVTGAKLEFGPGGFETYANQTGDYVLEIETYRFKIPMNGQFTYLTFRKSVEEQVRLVSVLLPRSRAEALLHAELEAGPATQGLFEIQAG
ncbi:MAG: SpoIID/LytB domain-containing protein, partial [Chloroflexota bacterium]